MKDQKRHKCIELVCPSCHPTLQGHHWRYPSSGISGIAVCQRPGCNATKEVVFTGCYGIPLGTRVIINARKSLRGLC